ncbi:Polymerase/histidinol phosphatase [Klenkia terrae]|uniref:PHP domain-containing protein n=1 Tax=Klenkia terrae TaxID=1052259 RepID=UPI00175B601C|nr:PHP domain-containing protein [Klenkia terrae]SSC24494.1 Polymerase/histidinol phosphatase [Klenkia terrae]
MTHEHQHDGHSHSHPHDHDHEHPVTDTGAAVDLQIPDAELSPGELGRRSFLRRAGLLGVGAAAAAGMGALGGLGTGTAQARRPGGAGPGAPASLMWLAGDHHIHTQYSPDAQYLVSQQVGQGARYGLDWMVITDHGGAAHQKFDVEVTHADVVAARAQNARTLVFQGVEWNIPAAEHGTVFVAPGDGDVALLKEFEGSYDGSVKGATAPNAANEALARDGLAFLGTAVQQGRVADALMLANHPARKGLDSPHEIRGWRDTAPTIAVGMEGAPGHQAAAIPGPGHATNGRGYYDSSPSADSFAAYPRESYLTYGGFDWMTATVGGLWDSLLAEGKPWWITANSDSHQVYQDTFAPGPGVHATTGSRGAPVDTGAPIPSYGDFWPGYYSRTVVGATDFSYGAVMAGIRAGRMYVVHGGLIGGLSAQVTGGGAAPATLGGTTMVNGGNDVELQVDVQLARRPNQHGDVPRLRKVDVVVGSITGAAGDQDSFLAPDTTVTASYEVPANASGTFTIRHRFGRRRRPFYVRLRGSDGNRTAPGLLGAAVDPAGPAVDALGNADPWTDLWFYTNPIFVLPR